MVYQTPLSSPRYFDVSLAVWLNYPTFVSILYKVIRNSIGNIKNYISNILGFEIIDKGNIREAIAHFPASIANFFDRQGRYGAYSRKKPFV